MGSKFYRPSHQIVHVVPLHRKSAEEVLGVFKTYCLTFGYPRKLITDNGKEFKNKEMSQFCDNNGIKLSHGSSRTPTTQGLVERSNRTWKESTRSLLMSTDKKVDHWCERTLESSYTMNISYHSTIKTSPYEAVFGFKAHREKATPLPEDNTTPKLKLTKRKHHQQLKPHPNRAPNAMRLTMRDHQKD